MSERAKGLKERAEYSEILKKTLHLKGSPVAMAILRQVPKGMKRWRGEHTGICNMIEHARRGEAFYIVGEDCYCAGSFFIGIANPPGEVYEGENYLSAAKHLFCSRQATAVHMKLVAERIPLRMGKYAAFAPLEKATFEPDVVAFIVVPLQAERLVILEAFDTGIFNTSHMDPMCCGVIATPHSTGKVGLSLLCPGSRQTSGYSPAVMGVGVPYATLHRIVGAIPHAHMGTASPDNDLLPIIPGREEVLRRFKDLDKNLDKYFEGV